MRHFSITPLFIKKTGLLAVAAAITSCSSDEPPTPEPPAAGDAPKTERIAVTVIDYSPAPGQFINEIPEWEEGDNAADMCHKATEMLNEGSIISLGAFGGSVTVRLSRPITRIAGKPEFQVSGNAIPTSSEPGIVYVSPDNAEWYMLKGEMGFDAGNMATITYSRPEPDATDATYIPWSVTYTGGSNPEAKGYIYRVPTYHTQDYFPAWTDAPTLTMTTLRLPDNSSFDAATGQYSLAPYKGYADSYPNSSADSYLDLDNAVDTDGMPVKDMRPINYVRIVTGILQNNGHLGECSTEVSGIARIIYE